MSQEVIRRLRGYEYLRHSLEETEQALAQLSPAERLVIQMLVIRQDRGNLGRLCQMLEVEKSTVYRIRTKALRQLADLLLTD